MNLVERICNMPCEYSSGNLSWHALRISLAKGAEGKSLTKKDFVQYLNKYPETIELWLRHSEDKRCTPSHCFFLKDASYILGFVNTDGKINEIFSSTNAAEVCTKFIEQECSIEFLSNG